MTLRTFIFGLKEAGIISNDTTKIVINLFENADADVLIYKETARGWLRKKPSKCCGNKYFDKNKINYKKIFDYIKAQTQHKRKKLQEIFRNGNDAECIIDLNTDDLNIFCLSLLNQFLSLVTLELVNDTNLFEKSEQVRESSTEESIEVKEGSVEVKEECIANPIGILDEFMKSFTDYALDEILGVSINLPMSECKINSFRLTDMINFIGHIRSNVTNAASESEKHCKTVNNFCDVLHEYVKALVQLSDDPKTALEKYKPADTTKLNDVCNSYTEELKKIYNEIKKGYEEKIRIEHDKLKTASKEIWIENTVKGSLFEE